VLYIVLAIALFLAAFACLAMCRLAALSDRLHAAALAEWTVASRYGVRTDDRLEQPSFGTPISARYRKAS
jgi:hypothetical protein